MQNILVIDDDTLVSGLLEAHLKDEGFLVRVVRRGDDGVVAATISKPDLILLDVMLPDATGYQICSQLRQLDSVQDVPIIMMSGVARYPNQKTYAMERGANDYLVKPFEIIEVGELVHSYLNNQTPVPPTPPKATESNPHVLKLEEQPMSRAPGLDEDSLDEVRRYLNNVLHNKGNP